MSNSLATEARARLVSIDALRGLVMLIMLLDHVRETIFLHEQVSDPVNPEATSLTLFIMRLLSSFCAPAFVLLTGLGAALYGQRHTRGETSAFLFKRGILLILIEVILINFAWTATFPPQKIYLQIIWCIGLCMISLSALLYLPKWAQLSLSVLIIFGHNLFDSLTLTDSHLLHPLWAILHQRDWISILGIPARTSYPVLPWIGIILGGFALGSFYQKEFLPKKRLILFAQLSTGCLISFFLLRSMNIYGDQPWQQYSGLSQTMVSFFALTKYPPSLLFTLLTLSFAFLCLILFERLDQKRGLRSLAQFGSGAMFFYILHLYVLKLIYIVLVAIFGKTKGDYFGVTYAYEVILWTMVIAIPLWFTTVVFVKFKKSHREIKLLSYL